MTNPALIAALTRLAAQLSEIGDTMVEVSSLVIASKPPAPSRREDVPEVRPEHIAWFTRNTVIQYDLDRTIYDHLLAVLEALASRQVNGEGREE